MKREKINILYNVLEEEVKKAQKLAAKLKEAANEIAIASSNSPSQSGDRFHSQSQADIAKEKNERLKNILDKVKLEVESEIKDYIQPICWVKLEYKDGVTEEFYYVDEPLSLEQLKFVSSGSSFGTAILGKKNGETFEFLSPEGTRLGKIISIE